MTSDSRRQLLRSAARTVVAGAISALAVTLGLRRPRKSAGYCDHTGRCGGCPVTADCHVFAALNEEDRR